MPCQVPNCLIFYSYGFLACRQSAKRIYRREITIICAISLPGSLWPRAASSRNLVSELFVFSPLMSAVHVYNDYRPLLTQVTAELIHKEHKATIKAYTPTAPGNACVEGGRDQR